MTIFRFDAEPRVNVIVDGKEIAAIVDTTSTRHTHPAA